VQYYKIIYVFFTNSFSGTWVFLSKHPFIYLLLINFVMMNKEVKLLLVAGVGYLGFKAYQIYTAIKKLSYAPTGIRFSIIKERGAIGGTLFVDIINPTAANITVDGFTGTVTTKEGTLIGDYRGDRLILKPGVNNVRISWGSRSSVLWLI
jgi:hypothetical protein